MSTWSDRDPDPPVDTSGPLRAQAVALVEQGRVDEAIDVFREVCQIKRTVFGEHVEVAMELLALGELLSEHKRFDGAVEAFEEAFAIQSNLYGERSIEAADCMVHLGMVQHSLGQFVAAKKNVNAALQIYREHTVKSDQEK